MELAAEEARVLLGPFPASTGHWYHSLYTHYIQRGRVLPLQPFSKGQGLVLHVDRGEGVPDKGVLAVFSPIDTREGKQRKSLAFEEDAASFTCISYLCLHTLLALKLRGTRRSGCRPPATLGSHPSHCSPEVARVVQLPACREEEEGRLSVY